MANAIFYLTLSFIVVMALLLFLAFIKYCIVIPGYWFYDRWPRCTRIGWVIISTIFIAWYIAILNHEFIMFNDFMDWITSIGKWYYQQLHEIFRS